MIIQEVIQIIIYCVAPILSQGFNRNIGQLHNCVTPLRELGFCVSLKNCPQVVNLFTTLPQNQAKQYSSALQRVCGHQKTLDNYPVVCCTQVVASNEHVTPGPQLQITSQQPISTPRPLVVEEKTSDKEPRLESSTTDSVSRPLPCQAPDSEDGFCIPLKECQMLFNRLQNNPDDEDTKVLLRESNKACKSIDTDVCCPGTTNGGGFTTERASVLVNNVFPRKVPSEEEGCGITQQSLKKVIGGEDSQIGAWPWIVLIGYDVWSLAPFKCGGTLVSARHVITAAHCLRSDLTFVRLGEFDLSIETETQHVDINVSKVVSHPNFGRDGRSDLAILYLVKNVEFTDLISPICLPSSPFLRTKSYIRSNPFVAGWGRTSPEGGGNSNVLQQLQIPVLENSVCRSSFRANNRLISEEQFDNSVICAGVLAGGKDSCQGDSGGPLMMPEAYKGKTRYYLIGVVSYGIKCAQIGVPGVYTSIQYFMDWIEKQIAEE